MKIPYIPVLIILSLAGLPSCVKDITLDAMEEPKVVVECILSDEPVQTLYLHYTKGASRSSAPDLPEATAVLTDLTEGKEAGRFARTADGFWTLAYAAIPSHRYRLDVAVPGHEPIWAEQTMPEPPDIYTSRPWSFWASSSTNPNEFAEKGFIQGSRYRLAYLPEFVWVYALDYDDGAEEFRIAEEICTDFPYVDDFNVMGTYDPEILSFYEWVYGNPCDGWALYPNLIGLGLHRRYLRLQNDKWDPENDREEFFVSGNFAGQYYAATGAGKPKSTEGRLVFASVSRDYDIYLQEALYCYDLQNSSDLSSLYYRHNVYSNIIGGLGILGAIVQTPLGWTRSYSPVNPKVVWDNPMTAPKPFYPEELPIYLM